MSIVKIIFIVAICFASLFILKKLVFNKIVIPISIFLRGMLSKGEKNRPSEHKIPMGDFHFVICIFRFHHLLSHHSATVAGS